MKLISDSTHGFLDYIMGISIIMSPSLFNFEWGSPEGYATFLTGTIILFYSFFTDYKPGVIRLISMPNHLITDRVTGLFLAASPWIFDFSTTLFLPHVVMGVLLICLSALSTETHQAADKQMMYLKHIKAHSPKRMMIQRQH